MEVSCAAYERCKNILLLLQFRIFGTVRAFPCVSDRTLASPAIAVAITPLMHSLREQRPSPRVSATFGRRANDRAKEYWCVQVDSVGQRCSVSTLQAMVPASSAFAGDLDPLRTLRPPASSPSSVWGLKYDLLRLSWSLQANACCCSPKDWVRRCPAVVSSSRCCQPFPLLYSLKADSCRKLIQVPNLCTVFGDYE